MAREFTGKVLPSEVDHVLVMVNGKRAFPAYVSPTQLNVQLPDETTAGPIHVQVIRDGTASASFSAALAANASGLFSYVSGNVRIAAATHADGSLVGTTSGSTPAQPGEHIALYATGLEASPAGTLFDAPIAITPLPRVSVGITDAAVQYTGVISPGVFQINVRVPQGARGTQTIRVLYGREASPADTILPITP